MVFCYKIITESPRRSRCASPRKSSPIGRYSSDITSYFDYEANKEEVWDSIPEREWKLLAALARKREEEQMRENLAEEFQKMWIKEKEEREMMEAETSEKYKRYLNQKRTEENYYNEYRRLQRDAEQEIKTDQLLHCIRYKERRSADLLAWRDDQKVTELVGKAVEEAERAWGAAERRARRGAVAAWHRHVQQLHARQKADDASTRRNEMLRNASQRLAINNTLSSWETSLIRQEMAAMDAARRAHVVAHCALKDARSVRFTRARENKRQRARRLAAITAQMRETIKSGR
ncbi:golgin subfamily A member 6-like protein 6 [Nymphalis io]|uniref:golgin subfamily A member 6-like protein 6 n=1 Tax=Inachis io TaxID=171585 RepID=UPI00216999E5|nr:golgin subfamily A member 6-like protein 6 [Nymphalis io]